MFRSLICFKKFLCEVRIQLYSFAYRYPISPTLFVKGIVLSPLMPFWYPSCNSFDHMYEDFGEGNGTPLQYSCLENPMDGGAGWAAVHGVAKSRTPLSDFTFTFHFRALEKEMATHSTVLAWRIPGMGEPGGLLFMGSHGVGHDWSDLAAVAAWGFISGLSSLFICLYMSIFMPIPHCFNYYIFVVNFEVRESDIPIFFLLFQDYCGSLGSFEIPYEF